jgi:hypothetical protein
MAGSLFIRRTLGEECHWRETSMKRLFIIVEGQTEVEFVNSTLREYLFMNNVFDVRALMIQTSKSHKGGFVNYVHLKNDVLRILKQQKDVIVTTFVDFFRIPTNIPNYSEAMSLSTSYLKAQELEKSIYSDIGDYRFIPYIQLHEFEALLFSSISGYINNYHNSPKVIINIEKIINDFPNPEDINDNPQTSPSNRLNQIIYDYNKILHGNIIAFDIGIDKIMKQCPRFNKWLKIIIEKVSEE